MELSVAMPVAGHLNTSKVVRSVELFLDWENMRHSLRELGCYSIDFEGLIRFVLRKFEERLELAALCGISEQEHSVVTHPVLRRHVWVFASVPFHFHPDDVEKVRRQRGFLETLRIRHGFTVEELPIDFCGHHISREDRLRGSVEADSCWVPHEKHVDAALVNRLVRRCLAADRPDGVVVLSGDGDFSFTLEELSRDPGVAVAVAAFRRSLSPIYLYGRNGREFGLPPIILDEAVDSLTAQTVGFQKQEISA